MVPGDATEEEISELPAVRIPAETGLARGMEANFHSCVQGVILDKHREKRACVKVRETARRTL